LCSAYSVALSSRLAVHPCIAKEVYPFYGTKEALFSGHVFGADERSIFLLLEV
jgi:hypothetical protein